MHVFYSIESHAGVFTTMMGSPGGLWFDPLGWGSASPEKVKDLRTREIKNGRLAMLAVLGAAFQAPLTTCWPTLLTLATTPFLL
jgi:hypothetical protein